jgi:hypothetical protein
MTVKMKDICLMCGGDWADVGVALLSIPVSVDINKAKKEYTIWKNDNKWISFEAWLIKFKGAKESDIEEFWDD